MLGNRGNPTKCYNINKCTRAAAAANRNDDVTIPLPSSPARHATGCRPQDTPLHPLAKRQLTVDSRPSMYKSRSSIDEWLSQRDNPTQTTRKRRRDDSEAEADVGEKHSDLPSPPITLCPADPNTTNSPPMQDSAAPCTTPVRPGKRRKEADGRGGGGSSDQDEDDPTPRRREDMPGWRVARSVGSQSNTQTSESQSTDSQTSSVKRRRRTHGLGLVAVGAPRL